MMDAASAEQYLRTVSDDETLEEVGKMVKSFFFYDPAESPPPPVTAR